MAVRLCLIGGVSRNCGFGGPQNMDDGSFWG